MKVNQWKSQSFSIKNRKAAHALLLTAFAGAWTFLTPVAEAGTLLTVSNYDSIRQRATIKVSDTASGLETDGRSVSLGSRLRVNTSSGQCIIEIAERVNSLLVAKTPECTDQILRTGLQLTYTPSNPGDSQFESEDVANRKPAWQQDTPQEDWPSEGRFSSNGRVATAAGWGPFAPLKDRISVYLGHNFSNDLEGKVTSAGDVKDLGGQTAFTLGLQGRVYNFSPRLGLSVGVGHEFMRTFNEATVLTNNQEARGPVPFNDIKLSLWSLYTQVEVQVIPKLLAFGGINIAVPSANQETLSFGSDLGFQVGAAYELASQIMVEGLVKITNLNARLLAATPTDVSLAGIEVRGRYTF